jgi:hypothetical protein
VQEAIMSNGTEAPAKKGLGTLAWVAIGCGVLILIVVVALAVGGLFVFNKAKQVADDLDFEGNPGLAAARMVVRLSPELEEVAVDEEAGTITVRNTKTGEEVTVDFEDLKEGKIRWQSGDREVTIDASESGDGGAVSVTEEGRSMKLTTGAAAAGEVPDWVPLYPGTEPSASHGESGTEGVRGTFRLETDDGVSEVIDFYRGELEGLGFEVSFNVLSGDTGDQGGLVRGTDEASGRSVTVLVSVDEQRTTVAITYREDR